MLVVLRMPPVLRKGQRMTSDAGFVLCLTGLSEPPPHLESILHAGEESVAERLAGPLTWLEQRSLTSSRDVGTSALRVGANGEPIQP
jgi:hypothetical protein